MLVCGAVCLVVCGLLLLLLHTQVAPKQYPGCDVHTHRHQLFADMVRQHATGVTATTSMTNNTHHDAEPRKPADLPVYESGVRGL